MAATNVYADMAGLIKNYITQDVDDYLNQSITVNNVTLTCDIYRVEDGSVLTNEVFTGCTENDANTQIIIGRTLSVAEGTTLTPPYRCKGLFIGSPGTFKNEGTISMTARGASAVGQNIALVDDYFISAVGGSGGSSQSGYSMNGNSGSTSSGLSCAGGGSGAHAYKGSSGYGGAGGNGTSYSGGAGGGGDSCGQAAGSGSSSGGAGGNGSNWSSASFAYVSSGGAGNPGGVSVGGGSSGSSGTGGLLVIFSDLINQNGSLNSQGSSGGTITVNGSNTCSGGGGSGGGCVILLSKIYNVTGTYNVNGGAGGVPVNTGAATYYTGKNGGNGGNGKYQELTVYDMEISEPTELTLGITLNEWVDDIEPKDGRLLGLMDDDELYYEYGGKRHRSSKGHNIEDEEGTVVPRRNSMVIQEPLTVADDSTEEKTMIGVDASGELDMTAFTPPSQLSPGVNQIGMLDDVEITTPADGQGLTYDATQQKWVNGAGGMHEYSTTEKVVGKWIDGRPIYEKVYDISSASVTTANTWTIIPNTKINDIYKAIKIEGFCRWLTTTADNYQSINVPSYQMAEHYLHACYQSNYGLMVVGNGFGLSNYAGAVSGSRECYLTIQYTKTTDTPTQT